MSEPSPGVRRATRRIATVEVVRFRGTAESATEVIDWALSNGGTIRYHDGPNAPDGGFLHIDTLEGVMRASAGDWVIRGVAGEFYPCKPDIFEETYELDVEPMDDGFAVLDECVTCGIETSSYEPDDGAPMCGGCQLAREES